MPKLRAVDLFCGAGGSTTGAIVGGVDVILAVNHWRTAIFSHQHNHPNVRHICARIEHIDARNDVMIPAFDLLMASPECTHHSIARGGKPVSDQSRQQPFALLDWVDAKQPRWLVVENVREFLDWGPLRNDGTERRPEWHPDKTRKGETFRAWVAAIESLGYKAAWSILNAADFGAATKRHRLFVIAKRGGGTIPFPTPTHSGHWRPAHEIIDWSIPCPSIFSRKRPLADKTLKRIEVGLRKFVGAAAEPFIVRLRGTGTVAPVTEPTDTITAGGTHHGLAVPFILPREGIFRGNQASGVDSPLHTIVAGRDSGHLCVPFLSQFHNGPDGERRTYPMTEPVPTLDTQPRYGLTMPYLVNMKGQSTAMGIDEPCPTLTAHAPHLNLAVPFLADVNHSGDDARVRSVEQPLGAVTTHRGVSLVLPFLTKFYGTGGANSIEEPVDTVTTKARFGLAMTSLLQTMQELHVIDVGFRMLTCEELARAQGFPEHYYLHGTKADQIKQVGNAVVPNVMQAICEAISV